MCVQKHIALIFLRSRLIGKLLWNESYVHYHGSEIDNANEQENLFLNLTIVIEFLKELQSIAQSKNILHQQSSIIMREYL